jgi:flagellar motor switch protein FliG
VSLILDQSRLKELNVTTEDIGVVIRSTIGFVASRGDTIKTIAYPFKGWRYWGDVLGRSGVNLVAKYAQQILFVVLLIVVGWMLLAVGQWMWERHLLSKNKKERALSEATREYIPRIDSQTQSQLDELVLLAQRHPRDFVAAVDRLTIEQTHNAAILFLSLENVSPGVMEPIFALLPKDHAKRILGAMSEIGRLLPEVCQPVIQDFYALAFDHEAIYGGRDVTTRIAAAVFGEDQTASIVKNNKERFRFLESVPAEDIIQFLGTETPQAKTLLFHYLSPKKASEVLMLLGDDPVVYALGKGVDVPAPDLLNEVEIAWSIYFDRLRKERSFSDDASVQKIAKMMEFLPKAQRDKLMKGYAQRSPQLGEKLKALVFTFDEVMALPDETLKVIMAEPFDFRQIAHVRFQLAPEWVAKINRCLSERMLDRADIESSGLSFDEERTDEAKRYFVEIARKLEQEGVVTLRCQN